MNQTATYEHPVPDLTDTVLIVDDDPTNIRLLLDILEQECRVVVARSGEQALKLLDKHGDINLMLLDVDMPGMSGFDVLEKLRGHPAYGDLPVILVTGRNQEHDEVFGLEQGAADYISKPLSSAVVRARVKTQIKLSRAKFDLERKNQELHQALIDINAAKNELAQFTAMVSHELRTPVAILLCEIELLVDGIREPSKQNLESLHDELKHFSGLINDLFDLVMSEASSLKYEKEACDIAALITRSNERFEPQFKDAGIDVDVAVGLIEGKSIQADPHRIRQVIDNLFKNTLRYTDPGGRLEVFAENQGDVMVLNFRDSEPGVQDADVEKLFDRLYRVEKSRNRSTGGAGLGLAVCKTIINDHNGDISAMQSPLGGLWIRISLPESDTVNNGGDN